MKKNVQFVDNSGQEIVIVPANRHNDLAYKGRNYITAALLTSILLTSCWGKSKDSAQTAKLKVQTEFSKDLDKAKNKLAKEQEDVVEAEKELENAQKAYDESLKQ